MAVYKKIDPRALTTKRIVSGNSGLWQSFFEKVTLEFNKEIFTLLRNSHKIAYINHQVISAKEYKRHFAQSMNLFFKFIPSGSLGFMSFPVNFCNYIVEHSLGGKNFEELTGGDEERELTTISQEIVVKFMLRFTRALLKALEGDYHLDIQILDWDDNRLLENSFMDEELISVQQFSVASQSGGTYYFDIVFKETLLK